MKRHLLILLTTLFSIAAIGLIILQIVQTSRSAKVSNNLFNINVCSAVDDVCSQLDQLKIEDFLTPRERYILQRYNRMEELNENMQDLIRDNKVLFYNNDQVSFGISTQDSAIVATPNHLTNAELAVLQRYNTLLSARNRILDSEDFSTFQTVSASSVPKIDVHHLNYPLIDSLLREELIIKCGEDLNPLIGFLETNTDTLLYCSNNADSDELANTPFRYTLQSNDIILSDGLFILLAFPSSPGILTSDTSLYTGISIGMIVLITLLFSLSVRAAYAQRRLNEMKTDFINNMTHEIKTPIATISLTCEMLQDRTLNENEEMRHNCVNIISDESRRMRILVETILQSAKMSGRHFSISPKEIDLNHIITESIQSFDITLHNRKGAITTDLKPLQGKLYADELHISNMLHNLIDNAIKYSTDSPDIAISTTMQDGKAQIKIADHGIGIAKADQSHIFEKFYRVSTGDIHNVKGFGIGLNYVAQVVRLHHGHISVESEPGKGTTFTILLPLA